MRGLTGASQKLGVTPHQWSILDTQLRSTEAELQGRLKRAARAYYQRAPNMEAARDFNRFLGGLEFGIARAYAFFDTYLDIFTQRLSTILGPVLGGCDIIAADALRKDHPALHLIEPPLVYLDRGFGASVLREGVPFPDGSPNPMPLVQIPYARLRGKYHLTSILHETGHEALVRLGIVSTVSRAFDNILARRGIPDDIRGLFGLWTREVVPDFWTFCNSGLAAAATVREILAVPRNRAFRVSPTDPHPPPYLRTLLNFEWCRQMWGQGLWDQWEREWLALYPLDDIPPGLRRILVRGKDLLPLVSRILFQSAFTELNGRRITDLFDFKILSPPRLERAASALARGEGLHDELTPSAQLSAFRLLRERYDVGEEGIDRLMTKWLRSLGGRQNN